LITLSSAFAEVSDGIEESIKALEDSLKSSFDSFADNFDGLFTNIQNNILETQNLINKLRGGSTSNPQDTLFNNLVKYNKALDEYAETGSKESYKNILDLSSVIGDSNSKLTNTLADNLEGFIDDFTSDQNTIRVNIVDGLGGLLGLNQEQVTQLKTVASDGKLTTDELNSIKGLTQTQKDGILDFAKNSDYFSTEATLSDLAKYSKLQLDEYNRQIAEETAGLSKQTLTYGDYIGKQEQIDIAKLLGVSFESAKPLIEQLQGLSLVGNKTDYYNRMKEIAGFNDSTGSYDKNKANQISALSQYLPAGGSRFSRFSGEGAINNLSAEQQKVVSSNLYNEYSSLYDQWQSIYTSSRNSGNYSGILDSYSAMKYLNDAYSNVDDYSLFNSKMKTLMNLYNTVSPKEENMLKFRDELYQLRGYAVGAVNIPNDQIAQIHKGETIIPATFADGLRQGKLSLSSIADAPKITPTQLYKGISSAFDNSVIVNELKAMREQLSYLNGLNTTQTATQLKTLSATRALIS